VSIASRPPSFAFLIRSSHICNNTHFKQSIFKLETKTKTKKVGTKRRHIIYDIYLYIYIHTHTYFRGASGVVNGSRYEDSPLAIDDNGFSIVSDTAMDQLRTHKEDGENK